MSERSVFALLNGLVKRMFFKEHLTDEFLHHELYSELPNEDFNILIGKYETLIKNISYSNMDLKQLDAYLTSQSKKKPDFLSEEEVKSLTKFWNQNRQKINDVVFSKTQIENKLIKVQWRIALSSKSSQTDDPKVVFNLETGKDETGDSIMFESDTTQLDNLVQKIESIEKLLGEYSK